MNKVQSAKKGAAKAQGVAKSPGRVSLKASDKAETMGGRIEEAVGRPKNIVRELAKKKR
jgi:hypothetical protein